MNASLNTITAEPAPESDSNLHSPEWWAELGRSIARRMAGTWGAEWKLHDTYELTERDKEFEAAERAELSPLFKAGEDDAYDARYKGCVSAWRDELAIRLRAKRASLCWEDVGLSSDDTRINRPQRHLLLSDGTTISGYLSKDEKHLIDGEPALTFGFRISDHKEVTIVIPRFAEFMPGPSSIKPAKTDRLVLRRQDDGYRHWLGRRDVHCGYGITLSLPTDHQIHGRYECCLSERDHDPIFYFCLAGGFDGVERVLRMPHDAEFVLEGRAL